MEEKSLKKCIFFKYSIWRSYLAVGNIMSSSVCHAPLPARMEAFKTRICLRAVDQYERLLQTHFNKVRHSSLTVQIYPTFKQVIPIYPFSFFFVNQILNAWWCVFLKRANKIWVNLCITKKTKTSILCIGVHNICCNL